MSARLDNSARTGAARLWTPANIVTLARICLVPVFVIALISPWPQWFGLPQVADDAKSFVAAGIFILISCTDWLDGYLARSRGEVTDFGKFMDPLADKILVAAALLALIELSVLPSWVALVILTREFIVSGIRMVAASQGVVIAASWYGKAKTVAQIIAIVLFIVKDSVVITTPEGVLHNPLYLVSWLVMIVALALTVVSMLDYFAKARELLGFSSAKSKDAADDLDDATDKAPVEDGSIRKEYADTTEAARDEFGTLPGCDVAAQVLEAARASGQTIGTAESLTGGLIAGTLTAVPGSSDVVRGGIVSYASEVKEDVLGVASSVIQREGVVSSQVACKMAEGARRELSCDVAVAVTGIAGPGGALAGQPVGTVWIGLVSGTHIVSQEFHFSGNRDEIRAATVRAALEMLLKELSA